MSGSAPHHLPGSLRSKAEKLARLYDDEIHPLFGRKFEQLLEQELTRLFEPAPAAPAPVFPDVLQVGCGAGALTAELVRRLPPDSRLVAIESSPALLDLAKERVAREHPTRRVFFRASEPERAIPFAEGSFSLVVANLGGFSFAGGPETEGGAAGLVRLLKPGGVLLLAAPLRGTWHEFLDLLREVLVRRWDVAAIAALDRYTAALPDPEPLARGLEGAGLGEVELGSERWELLFRSAREFFFAPVIEYGPLRAWKDIAGKGEVMQGIFNDVKATIETYFSGRPFAISVVAGCLRGTRVR